jgi:hypothetical protein
MHRDDGGCSSDPGNVAPDHHSVHNWPVAEHDIHDHGADHDLLLDDDSA